MGLKLITAPANDPVTLTEAKSHLRVDSSDDDTLITALITAATEDLDGPGGYLGRALIDQTWDLFLDAFPGDDSFIEIPLPPLVSVTGVYYTDTAGVEQTVSADNYVVNSYVEPARISLTADGTWPTPVTQADAVRIRFRAGYVDTSTSPATDSVPEAIKAAIKLTVGELYNYREPSVEGIKIQLIPVQERLLRRYRVQKGMA